MEQECNQVLKLQKNFLQYYRHTKITYEWKVNRQQTAPISFFRRQNQSLEHDIYEPWRDNIVIHDRLNYI